MEILHKALAAAANGTRIDDDVAATLAQVTDLDLLMRAASARRDGRDGGGAARDVITFSRNAFVPLTKLCRDVCHYCTFARSPKRGEQAYMSIEKVLKVARESAAAGCDEILMTLGDQPELRYKAARDALAQLGFASTIDYLREAARAVRDETGLLPHLNPGVMTLDQIQSLRSVSASMGLMIESTSERLCERGGPHFGSPDKKPAVRLATLDAAGEANVPFTTGLLIGIGETRLERIQTVLAIRASHTRHGHVQEVIVQNFRAKSDTLMRDAAEPSLGELLWTIAMARLVLDPEVGVQAPPNLSPHGLAQLIEAGIDDWGGVSPVTPDHVNPEAPWPTLERLRVATEASGKTLAPRLAIYPHYYANAERWLAPEIRPKVLALADAQGFARDDNWFPGATGATPAVWSQATSNRGSTGDDRAVDPQLEAILSLAAAGKDLTENQIVRLFESRGRDLQAVTAAADRLRAAVVGDPVAYVINRNINYTNVCYFKCGFCAFSKGRLSANLRGKPYDLPLEEISRRVQEAWARGATEVCMQGGIHPEYTGQTYLDILHTVKEAAPDIHIHAFSPLEVWQGASTLGLDLGDYLSALKSAGLGSLPGTAAEILDDEVRKVLCPDKVNTGQWLEVMERAHEVGLRSTATIMFGHVDAPINWARHLLAVRALQARTGGFTELVPLAFVASEAPIFLRGKSRAGPTSREALLMHAVARLVLHPHITNIQASWVKLGPDGVQACLAAGANDAGGSLMNESITRAAGAEHGQELGPEAMDALITAAGRTPRQTHDLVR